MIRVNSLYVDIKNNSILKDVSFEVEAGQICCVLGSNGAGKSTLMKTYLGQIRPSSGEISIGGICMNSVNRIPILKNVGVMIENACVYEHLSAYENLWIICQYHGLKKDKINNLLKKVGLSNTGNKKVSFFSSGMKQRLGLAMTLINDPAIIVLDEPTNALDPEGIYELRELILELNRKNGITFMINSHSIEEVKKIAHHIIMLKNGEVIYDVTSNSFLETDIESLFLKKTYRD